MNIEEIAQVAHEMNKAYCESLGDHTQTSWEDAPDWQKNSAVNGVKFHLDNPQADPSQSHQNWMDQKILEGWVYGEVKDAEKKTHPQLMPYAQLPPQQRSKDYIFRQVVHSLKKYLEVEVGA